MGVLVLTRKVGEGIRISDDIEIIPIRIKKNQVRLAIKAPESIKIRRSEDALKDEGVEGHVTRPLGNIPDEKGASL